MDGEFWTSTINKKGKKKHTSLENLNLLEYTATISNHGYNHIQILLPPFTWATRNLGLWHPIAISGLCVYSNVLRIGNQFFFHMGEAETY